MVLSTYDQRTQWLDAVQTPLVVLVSNQIAFINRYGRNQSHLPLAIGVEFTDYVEVSQRSRIKHYLLEAKENHPPVDCLLRFAHTPPQWVRISISPVVYQKQQANLLTLSDISQLHELEKLINDEKKRENLVEKLTSSFHFSARITNQQQLQPEWISPAFTELTGYPVQEMYSFRRAYQLVYPDDMPKIHDQIRRLTQGEEVIAEYRVIVKNGDVHWIRVWAVPQKFTDKGHAQMVFGTVQDITDRKNFEEALKNSTARLESVIRHLPLRVFTLNREGQITYSAGFDEQEEDGSANSLGEYVYEMDENQQEFLQDLDQVWQGQTITRERIHKNRVFETYLAPMYDESGLIMGAIGMGIDVTDRRRVEQAMVEHKTLRIALQKEVEINQLKSKMMERIAHEFRTPLSIIQLSAQIVERYDAKMTGQERAVRVDHILRQIRHLTRLLEDISLAVKGSSSSNPQRYHFDLRALIQAMVGELNAPGNSTRHYTLEVADEAVEVWGDARLIGLILQNLLSNAVKFSDTNSAIEVGAQMEDTTLSIYVQDAGIGILSEEQERIFEPFFRGSNFDERPGLGLGLSIVRDAVNKLQGHIELQSSASSGTRMIVYIPAAPPE